MEIELMQKVNKLSQKSQREKMLITSMRHLIKFYGYIVLPVGILTNAQWCFLIEVFHLKELKIDGVYYYRVLEKGEVV